MKRFFLSILCVSVFFVGLGYLVEKAGARFKSDEKALSLIKAARAAIGGDASVTGVQSLRIKGTTTHTFKMDGTDKTEPGETTIALQLPDKLSKTIKIGDGDESGAETKLVNRRVENIVIRRNADGTETVGKGEGQGLGVGTEPGVKTVVIKKRDGSGDDLKTGEQGNVIMLRTDKNGAPGDDVKFRVEHDRMEGLHAAMKQNEMFRLTLGLLLSPPAGMDANYTFAGESDVDGTPCNVIAADLGGQAVKLYLNKGSNLPVMMAYDAEPVMMFRFNSKQVPPPADGDHDVIFFTNVSDAKLASFQVKFSDYRSVNGVLLPYHWSTTGGDSREEFDVTSYEVNPADISSSFDDQKQKITLRVKKDGQ